MCYSQRLVERTEEILKIDEGRSLACGTGTVPNMEVRSTQFGRYDAQHIGHVQREIARSVKPNVLRQLENDDLSEEALERLLNEDLVELSDEAKSLLKQLRVQRKSKKRNQDDVLEAPRKDFLALLAGLEELRKQVEENDLEEAGLKPEEKPKPFLPPVLMLSQHQPRPPSAPTPNRLGATRSNTQWLNRAGEIAKKMIAIAPRPELRDQVAYEMQAFGEPILSQMKQFGIRVVILGRNTPLTELRINGMHVVAPSEKTFDGRPWSIVRGLYDQSRRMLVVGEELLQSSEGSVVHHELAHAYDHFFMEKNHRRQPLSVQLWNSFRDERTGLVSAYAGTNPAEYFAESVEAFFHPLQREQLRQRDGRLYDYLVQLFN